LAREERGIAGKGTESFNVPLNYCGERKARADNRRGKGKPSDTRRGDRTLFTLGEC